MYVKRYIHILHISMIIYTCVCASFSLLEIKKQIMSLAKIAVQTCDPAGKDKEALVSTDDDSRFYWNKKTRFKWTITYFFGSFFVYSVRTCMSICAASMAKELGWNKQVSGMALSAFFSGYVSTNVIGGYLADRYGGERTIIYSSMMWSSVTLLIPYLANSNTLLNPGTIVIIGGRVLTGMSQGFFFPSLVAIILKHVPVNERGFVYGFASSGSTLGTIATGFFGSFMIDYFGWQSVFKSLGVVSFLWVLWMTRLYNVTNPRSQKREIITKAKEPIPWLKIFSKKPFWALVVAYFCSSLVFYNLLSWTPVYFHEAFPESKGWIFNVVPWVVNFILANILGYLANVLLSSGVSVTTLRKSYAAALFLGVAVFSLMLTAVETFKQALFVMSLTIGVNAFQSCALSLNSQDLCPKHAGAVHGMVNCTGAFAGFIGVYLTGYILESAGHWSSVFMLTSAISVFGFFGFQMYGTGERIL